MRRPLALLALLVGACVARVELEGTRCPCPEDLRCCETISTCIQSTDTCPAEYPPGSASACESDADCPGSERCQAWSTAGGLAGPRACRRACPGAFPCSGEERCELTLHDGAPLEALRAERLCVPSDFTAGCGGVSCSQCEPGQLGQTFCAGDELRACFFALDPQCGLACRPTLLHDCGEAGCELTGGQSSCGARSGFDPCVSFACSRCVAPRGELVCDGSEQLSCGRVRVEESACSELCLPDRTPCPGGCDSSGGGARCHF